MPPPDAGAPSGGPSSFARGMAAAKSRALPAGQAGPGRRSHGSSRAVAGSSLTPEPAHLRSACRSVARAEWAMDLDRGAEAGRHRPLEGPRRCLGEGDEGERSGGTVGQEEGGDVARQRELLLGVVRQGLEIGGRVGAFGGALLGGREIVPGIHPEDEGAPGGELTGHFGRLGSRRVAGEEQHHLAGRPGRPVDRELSEAPVQQLLGSGRCWNGWSRGGGRELEQDREEDRKAGGHFVVLSLSLCPGLQEAYPEPGRRSILLVMRRSTRRLALALLTAATTVDRRHRPDRRPGPAGRARLRHGSRRRGAARPPSPARFRGGRRSALGGPAEVRGRRPRPAGGDRRLEPERPAAHPERLHPRPPGAPDRRYGRPPPRPGGREARWRHRRRRRPCRSWSWRRRDRGRAGLGHPGAGRGGLAAAPPPGGRPPAGRLPALGVRRERPRGRPIRIRERTASCGPRACPAARAAPSPWRSTCRAGRSPRRARRPASGSTGCWSWSSSVPGGCRSRAPPPPPPAWWMRPASTPPASPASTTCGGRSPSSAMSTPRGASRPSARAPS